MVTLSVPHHREVAKGTLRSLIRSAGLTVNDFFCEQIERFAFVCPVYYSIGYSSSPACCGYPIQSRENRPKLCLHQDGFNHFHSGAR